MQASNRGSYPPYVQGKIDELHAKVGITDPGCDKLYLMVHRRDAHNFDIHSWYGIYDQARYADYAQNNLVHNNDDAQKILNDIGYHMAAGFADGRYLYPAEIMDIPIGECICLNFR